MIRPFGIQALNETKGCISSVIDCNISQRREYIIFIIWYNQHNFYDSKGISVQYVMSIILKLPKFYDV